MPDKPWKRRERQGARQVGAERNIGSGSMGRADRSRSDSTHDSIFLECKLREKHSAVQLWRQTAKLAKKEKKTPIVALFEKGMPHTYYVVRDDHVEILADVIRQANKAKSTEPLEGQSSFLGDEDDES